MNKERRDFIKTGISTGALALSAAPLLSACSPANHRIDPVADVVTGLNRQQVTMLRYASLAPSGHNSQPWTVAVPDQV